MPQYEVVRLGGAIPVCVPEYGVLASARLPAGLDSKQFAVRPVRDLNWRDRERKRLEDGTYKPLPWPGWVMENLRCYVAKDHFPHVSTKDPTKVSFTDCVEKGEVDRQTTMAPGRYLERYARYRVDSTDKWMTADDIRTFASMLLPPDPVKFAKTEDEIEYVYVHGPRSCMSGSADEYSSPFHPARVYAAGDLEVAYLAVESDITGRVLCWPEKKRYGRIYGDISRLEVALNDLGYSHGSLVGARLLRHEYRDGFVCPYIDHHFSVDDCGDYLKIAERGSYRADSTDGLTFRGTSCDNCGDMIPFDEELILDDETLCEYCHNNNTFYCAGHGETEHNNNHHGHVEGVGEVCDNYYEDHCFTCDRLDLAFHNDEAVEMANGDIWSRRAFERYGATCPYTDENHPHDDLVMLTDTLEYVSAEWAKANAFEKDGEYYLNEPEPIEEAA